MVSNRRRAAENSATRAELVAAAEQIIQDEGYAAVSSRTLAEKLNLKRQIVHYYFKSMDDVFIAVIRSGAEKSLAQLEKALASEEPLRAVWELSSDPRQAILTLELSALAQRRPAVKAEVKDFAEKSREMQTQALLRHLELRGISSPIQPIAVTVLISCVSQILALESAIDMTKGHEEVLALVDECLRAFAVGGQFSIGDASLAISQLTDVGCENR